MSETNSAPGLPPSLKAAAEKLAAAEAVSLEQLINFAPAEKLAAMQTIDYVRDLAATARPGAFLAWLYGAGDEPLRAWDET